MGTRVADRRACPSGCWRRLDHPRWADVAERCLACANCTLVCPTCFCTSVEPAVRPRRRRARPPSGPGTRCFTDDFAKVAGGTFRPRAAGPLPPVADPQVRDLVGPVRHRRGCVGCGRCITWCPVGIDVREELMAIAPAAGRARPRLPGRRRADACPPRRPCRRRVEPDRVAAETSATRTTLVTLADCRPADRSPPAGRPGQFVMAAPARPSRPRRSRSRASAATASS